jgi:hypothetical protein
MRIRLPSQMRIRHVRIRLSLLFATEASRLGRLGARVTVRDATEASGPLRQRSSTLLYAASGPLRLPLLYLAPTPKLALAWDCCCTRRLLY